MKQIGYGKQSQLARVHAAASVLQPSTDVNLEQPVQQVPACVGRPPSKGGRSILPNMGARGISKEHNGPYLQTDLATSPRVTEGSFHCVTNGNAGTGSQHGYTQKQPFSRMLNEIQEDDDQENLLPVDAIFRTEDQRPKKMQHQVQHTDLQVSRKASQEFVSARAAVTTQQVARQAKATTLNSNQVSPDMRHIAKKQSQLQLGQVKVDKTRNGLANPEQKHFVYHTQ